MDDSTFQPQRGRAVIKPGVRRYDQTIFAITPDAWQLHVRLLRGANLNVRGIVGGSTRIIFERDKSDDDREEIEIEWWITLRQQPSPDSQQATHKSAGLLGYGPCA